MPCYNCGESTHMKSNCPWIVCFQCGQNGHLGSACPKPKFHRARICWTCKRTDHKRGDVECPGPVGYFCSYCLTDDITTESCPCNGVTTKNLKRREVTKPIRERLGKKDKDQREKRNQPSTSSHKRSEKPKKDNQLLAHCCLSVKIGTGNYSAIIDPERTTSSINTESVYIEHYNGIDEYIRVKASIYGIQREITFETNPQLEPYIILGADALVTFQIRVTIGDKNLTEINRKNAPTIVKSPQRLSLIKIPFKNPVNLNLADPNDEEVDIHNVPMGEFLERISEVCDSSSSDDGIKKPHPNRRLFTQRKRLNENGYNGPA